MTSKKRQSPDVPMPPGGRQSPRGSKISVPIPRPGEGSSRGSQAEYENQLAREHQKELKQTDSMIRAQRKKAGLSTD